MRFAHLADLHLGSWREPKMRDISTTVFLNAIDNCINKQVDFIIFAGDLFNTSMPAVDTLKIVTKKLKELKDKDIPLYAIAGSHDFSPSGKTMLDVLENAGLLVNVCKGEINRDTTQLQLKLTIDKKTGAKITGIIGRRGLLDRSYYENLDRDIIEKEQGYKIFLFHTTLTELKPKHLEMIDSQPASFLPKNFNYYAGGHIHHKTLINIPEYGPMSYPGALFPNNFSELEKYSHGWYYLIDVETNHVLHDREKKYDQQIEWIPLDFIRHKKLKINCDNKNPSQIYDEIINYFSDKKIEGNLITINLVGEMSEGKPSEINFKKIFEELTLQGAYFIMRNTNKLTTKEFEEIKTLPDHISIEEFEERVIKEHLQQFKTFTPELETSLSKSLLHNLNTKKIEGEKSYDFQERVFKEIKNLLKVE